MSNDGSRLLTRMPVRYNSFNDFQYQIQMEEEPTVLPLISTVATLTLSSLASTLNSASPSPTSLSASSSPISPGASSPMSPSASPSPTRESYEHDEQTINKDDNNNSPTEERNICKERQIHNINNVACEIAKRFKHCMPQTPGESDMHRAAFTGNVEYLQSLLNVGDSVNFNYRRTRINQKNRLGCTPIRLAATGGHVECMSLLIDAGASIDAVDVKCQTPLFVAIKNRRLECALKLLQCGAKPEGDPGNSSTPMYVAIMNGDINYILLLLQFGADPDKLRHSRVSSTIHSHKFTTLNLVIENIGGEDCVYMGVKALLKAGCCKENLDVLSVVLNDYKRVLELLFDFGVPFGGREKIDRIFAEFPRQNSCKHRLQQLTEQPRSLMSSCRIAITKCLQSNPYFEDLNSLPLLPLPTAFLSYLVYRHE